VLKERVAMWRGRGRLSWCGVLAITEENNGRRIQEKKALHALGKEGSCLLAEK